MRFQRRGIRDGLGLAVFQQPFQNEEKTEEKKISQEDFNQWIKTYLMPKQNHLGAISPYQAYFEALSKEQQKNLTDKIVNQILWSHPDMVLDVFRKLAKLSLDFSQQTEVLYRRKKLESASY